MNEDYNTRTVAGAAAHAAKFAEPYNPNEGWDGGCTSDHEEEEHCETYRDLLKLLQAMDDGDLDKAIRVSITVEGSIPLHRVEGWINNLVTHPDPDDEDYPFLRED